VTAVTLPHPCWALRPEDEWEDSHYKSREDAQAVVDQENADREPDEPRYGKHPEQLDYRCIEVICDECDNGLDDEDGSFTVHCANRCTVPTEESRAEQIGWVVIRTKGVPNLHFCPRPKCQATSRNWTGGRS
jgi:hypothetical protein